MLLLIEQLLLFVEQNKDFLIGISSVIGMLGGIPKIFEYIQKKPRLSISDVKIKIFEDYFSIDCKIWNGKCRLQRIRIANATDSQLDMMVVDNKSAIVGSKNLSFASKIITPKNHIPIHTEFGYNKNLDAIILLVKCEEGSQCTKREKIQ